MKVKTLLDGIEFEWLTHERVERIKNVTHKASEIKEGDCYISLHTNKENMIQMEKAIQNGATLVITDKYILTSEKVAVVRVKDIRESYALIAKNYYMKACDSMKMIAVVGTNGKSTTSYLVWSLLTKNNIMCGLIGTGFYMIGKKRFKMDMTTPDPMELYMILSVMANCGTQIVVMEVSSHAIYYKKTNGIKYNIGVFTNLSQDHLDFFGSMENLEEVKHSFFLNGNAQISLINIDDNSGSKLAQMLSLPNITLGFDSNADIIITNNELSVNGSKFNVNLFNEDTTFESKLVGRYNIYNILSAVLVCKLLGVRIKGLINSLREIEPLDGRANIIVHNDINFVIDFAHSPDGLQNILT
ncbi:MAG: UDP-N-acetylmuramyl-tripeptide synthetase, partial [Clostridia bacterium]|nr:UDP-N-acetylmuramyl-tripeptide synthetase [Clostridia bacterium]